MDSKLIKHYIDTNNLDKLKEYKQELLDVEINYYNLNYNIFTYASNVGHLEIVKLLIELGANVHTNNERSTLALSISNASIYC